MYEYKATLVKVVDGDTVDLDVSLGFHITIRQRCRLRGLNAPETRGPTKAAGDAATQFAKDWLSQETNLIIRSSKPYADDKYGRWVVSVSTPNSSATLNEALIAAGHAVPYMDD